MSRREDCWDNAVAASFFGTLKQEMLFRRAYELRVAAQNAIFEAERIPGLAQIPAQPGQAYRERNLRL